MSQENAKPRHLQKCEPLPESIPDGCAVLVTGSNDLKVPLQKRKEEAKQPLYLIRV